MRKILILLTTLIICLTLVFCKPTYTELESFNGNYNNVVWLEEKDEELAMWLV